MRAVMALIVLVCVCPIFAQYSGGSGTAEDPYQIATAEDLIALGEEPNDYDKHFILTADIDLDPNLPGRRVFDRAVIAPDTDPTRYEYNWYLFDGPAFTGVFNGNGHMVSNLTIVGADCLGLFGGTESATIFNLGLGAVDVNGTGGFVGGLVGYNYGGYEWRVSISNCYSSGSVSGTDDVGGLVGANVNGVLSDCYCIAAVSGQSDIGGLVGISIRDFDPGRPPLWATSGIYHCFSAGPVDGQSSVGGLIADNGAEIISSFWDMESSGQSASDGGMGLTTTEMKQQSTFDGWDFINVWDMGEGQTYPFLRTHSAGDGDVNKDGIVNFLDLCVVAQQWMEIR